ncbi:MAG: ImmA/IrrE family metallo-endopeptidase [Oscillospiraceae bacterium]|nr:ImmA/IrrE family metallo-endopeptidase [Oscillospiraceae bacterium]
MNKKQIKQKVLETLNHFCNQGKELCLPIPIKAIAKSFHNIRVIPYSIHMKRSGMTIDEMYKHSGTKDAYTDFNADTNQYVIYYNDMDKIINESYRYRWSIAHELGHIVLRHHNNQKTKLFRNRISKTEYKNLEYEADWFASYILVPYAILDILICPINEVLIKSICNISLGAAKYRKVDFYKWTASRSEYDFYDTSLLKIFSHKKVCNKCKVILNDDYTYCHVCGKKNNIYYKNSFRKEYESVMKYQKLNSYNGILTRCPICDNEEIVENAKFCHICGAPMENLCFNDENFGEIIQCSEAADKSIPTNARYCPYCGSSSLFFVKGLLKEWTKEYNTQTTYANGYTKTDDFDKIMNSPAPF